MVRHRPAPRHRPESRLRACTPWRRARFGLAVVLCLLVSAPVLAQVVEFELGVAGEVVAGAWNPLRITTHDVPPSRLEIRIDDGSLRDGPRIARYSMAIPGGSGVTVFEDDVYVPRFRALNWSVANPDRVVASGSLGVREADERPLDLLLSAAPGRWRAAFLEDARPIDVAGSQLPDRVAAYDGVRSLAIDGSAAAPRLAAVAAAAAGGVRVVLLGDLPPSQADLMLLSGAGSGAAGGRIGAGAVVRAAADSDALATAIAAVDTPERNALLEALAHDPLVHAPTAVPQPLLLSLTGAFVLLVLALVRFAGSPGVVATMILTGIVAVAAWQFLRPASPLLQATQVAWLGGGDLALRLAVEEVLTLPAGEVDLDGRARPQPSLPYRIDDRGTHLSLDRWHAATLWLRPALAPAALRYGDAGLHNVGRAPLTAVYVVGLGRQAALAAGQTRAPVATEDGALSPLYGRLVPLLPDGTALARDGPNIWLALPTMLASGPVTP